MAEIITINNKIYDAASIGSGVKHDVRVNGTVEYQYLSASGNYNIICNLTLDVRRTSSSSWGRWQNNDPENSGSGQLFMDLHGIRLVPRDEFNFTQHSPLSVCTGCASVGTWVNVMSVSKTLTNVSWSAISGQPYLKWCVWASGAGVRYCPTQGKNSVSNIGPTGDYPIFPDKLIEISWWNGTKDNTADGGGIWGIVVPAGEKRYSQLPTDPMGPPPLSNGPEHISPNPAAPSNPDPGVTYTFIGWKVGGPPPGNSYQWNQPVNNTVRFIAQWKAGGGITAEYYDGIPNGTGQLITLPDGRKAQYPPQPNDAKLPEIQKDKSHLETHASYVVPPVPIWTPAQLAMLPPPPAGSTQEAPEFKGWERFVPEPDEIEFNTGNKPLPVSHKWRAKWLVPPPKPEGSDEDPGKCKVGGGLWLSNGGPWRTFPQDYEKVTPSGPCTPSVETEWRRQ